VHFHSFAIISPWRGTIPFLSTKLNPLHPKMICVKSGKNWPSDSPEENFLKNPIPFLHFCDYLPFEEDLPLQGGNHIFKNVYELFMKFHEMFMDGS
jgi:hypothetical protein